MSAPIVILVGSALPAADADDPVTFFAPPLALTSLHSRTLIEHWWETLTAAGLASTTHVFVATNAIAYKYFEFWSLGKGIPISHIINSGRSLGDARVDLGTIAQVLRTFHHAHGTTQESAPTDVLVIACDSAPPHTGAAFRSTLANAAAAPTSMLLLQPPHGDASAGSPFQSGGGPVIRAYHRPLTTPYVPEELPSPKASPAESSSDFEAARDRVLDIKISIDLDSHHEPAVASEPGVLASFSPVVYFLKAADVSAVTSAPVLKELLASCAALQGFAVAVDPPAGSHGLKLVRKHGGPVPAGVTEGAAMPVTPIEAGVAWLARNRVVQGLRIRDAFQVGAADGSPHGIPAATDAAAHTASKRGSFAGTSAAFAAAHAPIHTSANARVGLLGNPSDGFAGKTLSVTIRNFRAEVLLSPHSDASITIQPHTVYDATTFANLRHVSTVAGREGYNGGIRLLCAALHRFFLHCRSRDVTLPDRGFTARYHTTVPKQVGLAGSSAIVTAFVRALLRFYGFGTEEKAAAIGLSRDQLPGFVLAIENEELGITAGLQDRVVQAYQGAVHMNFDAALLKAQGFGQYTKIPVRSLPPLFLAYAADPSDSGRIHAPVKQRWLAGDVEVVDGMKRIASYADAAAELCASRPYADATTAADREAIVQQWAQLFYNNFESRRKLFGDAALGRDNIRMVEIARETGASGKFPGSGGAIVGVVDVAGIAAAGKLPSYAPALDAAAPPDVQQSIAAARVAAATEALREAYLAEGYVFTRIEPFEA